MIQSQTRYFIDANIFLYCAGDDERLRFASIETLKAIERMNSLTVTSVAVLEEAHFLFYRQSQDRHATLEFLHNLVRSVGLILPVTRADYDLALRLFQGVQLPLQSVNDYYHVACMKNHTIQWIVSNDTDFDRFEDLHRIDPRTVTKEAP